MLQNNNDDYREEVGEERLGSLLLIDFIAYVVSKKFIAKK